MRRELSNAVVPQVSFLRDDNAENESTGPSSLQNANYELQIVFSNSNRIAASFANLQFHRRQAGA